MEIKHREYCFKMRKNLLKDPNLKKFLNKRDTNNMHGK